MFKSVRFLRSLVSAFLVARCKSVSSGDHQGTGRLWNKQVVFGMACKPAVCKVPFSKSKASSTLSKSSASPSISLSLNFCQSALSIHQRGELRSSGLSLLSMRMGAWSLVWKSSNVLHWKSERQFELAIEISIHDKVVSRFTCVENTYVPILN